MAGRLNAAPHDRHVADRSADAWRRYPQLGAPSATRTRDLLLRRHSGPSAALTCEDAGQQRPIGSKAVAPWTIFDQDPQ
jgi:hypothetical protein